MRHIYETIELARKYSGGPGALVEAVTVQNIAQADKTGLALDVARHFAESKPAEPVPVQMPALPPS